jgi:ABC-type Na+ efflux pump permease subunit
MSDRVGFLFGGPILRRELTRATRRPVPTLLRYAFIAALCFEFLMLSGAHAPPDPQRTFTPVVRIGRPIYYPGAYDLLELRRQEALALVANAEKYVSFLLYQQLLCLLLVTPVVTAGAVVYEKERDTLQALFGTELRSREIVVGKVLGRLIALGITTAALLPPLAFATSLASLPVWRVVLALIQAAVLAYALASACVLLSLWTRRTTDAIIGCYATMVVASLLAPIGLAAVYSTGFVSLTDALNPLAVLDQLLSANSDVQPFTLLLHLALWGGAGTLCLAVAAYRVRPVSSALMESRAPRWLWAFRPPIGNAPVRWREQYVLGLAPIAVLRMIPRWMGRLGVLSFSLILAGDSLGHVVGRHVFRLIQEFDFAAVWTLLQRPMMNRLSDDINIMGAALLVLGAVTVCVRCAGSIAEEKRRKTWEDLILTPLSLSEIMEQKYAGILWAAVLPVVMYTLPMFALSTLGGAGAVFQTAAWVVGSVALIPIAGGFGMMLADGMEGGSAVDRSDEDPVGQILGRPYSARARQRPTSGRWDS